MVDILRRRFPADEAGAGIGDDAAVFATPGRTLLFTTDTIVEGVDFDLGYASGTDLGWKVIAINVSDIAAMGGEPAQAVATMCMPASTSAALVEDVADGMAAASAEWGVPVVGGDLSNAPMISLGVALLGAIDGAVLRSGAAVGDAICVTGSLGGSAGGLAMLRADAAASGPLVERHLRPRARLKEGRALREVGATAMLDLSDGLVVDLGRLLRASGVGCEVEPASVPVDPQLARSDVDPLQAALFGGEDFELLFTLPAERVEDASARLLALDTPMSQIGTVTAGEARLGDEDLDALKEESWDHLRRR